MRFSQAPPQQASPEPGPHDDKPQLPDDPPVPDEPPDPPAPPECGAPPLAGDPPDPPVEGTPPLPDPPVEGTPPLPEMPPVAGDPPVPDTPPDATPPLPDVAPVPIPPLAAPPVLFAPPDDELAPVPPTAPPPPDPAEPSFVPPSREDALSKAAPQPTSATLIAAPTTARRIFASIPDALTAGGVTSETNDESCRSLATRGRLRPNCIIQTLRRSVPPRIEKCRRKQATCPGDPAKTCCKRMMDLCQVAPVACSDAVDAVRRDRRSSGHS